MISWVQEKVVAILRWSEKYTKTDMVYLASGGFWLVLEQISGIALSLLVAIAFGHFAGKDTYGNYKYVLSLAAMLGALSLSGLSDAVGQAAAKGKDGVLKQAFWMNLRWSWPFSIAALCLSAYYCAQGNPFVSGSLVIIATLQPLVASSSLFASFLFGQKDFARGALYVMTKNLFTYGSVLAALFFGERAIMLVATYFVATSLVSLFFAWKAQRRARNGDKDEQLFSFGAHLSAMNIFGAIADKFDSVIIFSLLGPAELATYAFALAAPEQIKGVVKNMYGLALPRFAERPFEEVKVTVWRKIALLTLGIAALIGTYIVFAPLLFKLFFPIYMDAIPYTRWYALSILFAGIPPVLVSALTAHKKTKALYVSTNAPSIVLIVALLVLVPQFGLGGAIAAQIVFRLSNALITGWQFLKA